MHIGDVDAQILTSRGCEYGMYNHADSTNSQLTDDGWSAVTFDELSGEYKDDFIQFYNENGGITSLITWNSNNCCFAFPESSDSRLTINVGDDDVNCYVYPAIGTVVSQCSPSDGYTAGTKYTLFSLNRCDDNGDQFFETIPTSGVTFGTTTQCTQADNPGIWRRCSMFNCFYLHLFFVHVLISFSFCFFFFFTYKISICESISK